MQMNGTVYKYDRQPDITARCLSTNKRYTYLCFLFVLVVFQHPSYHTILLHFVAVLKGMLMRSCDTVPFPIPTVSIHPLQGIELFGRNRCYLHCRAHGRHPPSIDVCRNRHVRLREEGILQCIIQWWMQACLLRKLRAIEIFCYFDLDIAQISLPGYALPFLLIWIGRLLRAGWSAFEAAVPVVRDEAFALMSLRGAVGIHIVDVGKVRLESRELIRSEQSEWL